MKLKLNDKSKSKFTYIFVNKVNFYNDKHKSIISLFSI